MIFRHQLFTKFSDRLHLNISRTIGPTLVFDIGVEATDGANSDALIEVRGVTTLAVIGSALLDGSIRQQLNSIKTRLSSD